MATVVSRIDFLTQEQISTFNVLLTHPFVDPHFQDCPRCLRRRGLGGFPSRGERICETCGHNWSLEEKVIYYQKIIRSAAGGSQSRRVALKHLLEDRWEEIVALRNYSDTMRNVKPERKQSGTTKEVAKTEDGI